MIPMGYLKAPYLDLHYLTSFQYVNGLVSLNNENIAGFADDTANFYRADSWEALKDKVETEFFDIKLRLDKKLLTVNVDKTCFYRSTVIQFENHHSTN